jgi:hypothetical protein
VKAQNGDVPPEEPGAKNSASIIVAVIVHLFAIGMLEAG